MLAAIPIVIHILNRRRYKTVNWAAMEFLLRAMKMYRRRLLFEYWAHAACLVQGESAVGPLEMQRRAKLKRALADDEAWLLEIEAVAAA